MSRKYPLLVGTIPQVKTQPVELPPPNPMNAGLGAAPKALLSPVRAPVEVVRLRKARIVRPAGRMRTYLPHNAALMNAAWSGFIAGMRFAISLMDSDGSSDAALETEAQAFAEAVDALIAPGAYTPSQAQAMYAVVTSEWAYRGSTVLSLDYEPIANAVVSLFEATIADQPATAAGAAFAPNQYLDATDAPWPVTLVGLPLRVSLDTTLGSFVVPMPTNATDGQPLGFKDISGSWMLHPPGLSVGPGVSIETNVLGTYVTNGTFTLPNLENGEGYNYIYWQRKTLWALDS